MKHTKEEILEAFSIGFEFEMMSKLPKKDIIKSIEKICGVKITIPTEVSGFNKIKPKIHSDFKPTETEWKLENDYSGGESMHELVTGPLPYKVARMQLIICNQ